MHGENKKCVAEGGQEKREVGRPVGRGSAEVQF
jgi:hypothetical protein